MNTTVRRAVLASGLTVAVFGAAGGGYALATGSTAPVQPVTSTDHSRVTVTVAPGGTSTFVLPVKKEPVRIDIGTTTKNAGLQTPSAVFGALVNPDSYAAGLTWIGTNSDGTSTAGHSFGTGTIATLGCGTGCTVASLSVNDAASGRLALSVSSTTTVNPVSFTVDLWY